VTKEELHRAQDYRLGWFAHPLFSKEGGYPKIMIEEIGKRCKLEGRAFSRLPKMDKKTKAFVRESSDFFGINYYTSRLISVDRSEHNLTDTPAWFKDAKSIIHVDPKWKRGKSEWLYSVPEGLRHLLKWIKDEYENPPVFITENGWSDEGELEDFGRIEYLKSHLSAVSKAINEDNCNVIGYTAWSLLDSFEWDRGYTEKFGIFSVNFSSPRRERKAKKSAMFLRKIIKKRKL
jgi:beta-glucosidase/6-phospho-beta-glucosidase/beta-galactosidase